MVEVLYVRVENTSNPTCFSIETIALKVIREPIIAVISDLFACEDTLPTDGAIRFDLSIKDLEILNGQSGTQFDVDYYLTSSDAQNDVNPLNQFFINSTNPQTLYVRVFNIEARNCYKIGSFYLNVNPKPDFLFDSIYTICEGSNAISISAPNGFSHYQWSNGAVIPKTTISQPGNYTLTVGQQYGDLRCETTKNFTVVESEVATIVEIEISDFNGNDNVISVNVNGSGNYEYSVDGIHYQDSNVFYGLGTGEYIVFVRDKNGCGIIQERIYLLDYPKFFTPNGDGINDYWRIEFSAFEPNLKVEIFDRYGKLIKDLNADSIGWNGKLNDRLLPSDDYWFVVLRENGKQYRGHFSLKR
ncbi:MAG: T9SS type B sorting domain-containing protein [Flavobacterium sp. JAD_PAG50586_2]|nr:MAG: T9SS type B sorting domain-containing protein [Flavobacterium sp. JAD_PAG50586_2]